MTGPEILRRIGASLIAVIAAAVAASPAAACGRDTDCIIGARSYRIALPEGHDGTAPIGAIVFIHGFRGTAARVMRNDALTALAADLGVAFIAANAAGPEWNIPHIPSIDAREGVDELTYFDALAADLAARFGVDRGRIMVAGFSSGGMMVWHLACQRGAAFAGYVAMSGTFWEPMPETCPGGAVNLIHYHGTEDGVVPLAGRRIKDAHQGDVRAALDMLARSGGYRPVPAVESPGLDCTRQRAPGGELLELCLFAGGHVMRVARIVRAWREFGLEPGG